MFISFEYLSNADLVLGFRLNQFLNTLNIKVIMNILKNCIEEQLIYNVALISVVQQGDSVNIFFFIFPFIMYKLFL